MLTEPKHYSSHFTDIIKDPDKEYLMLMGLILKDMWFLAPLEGLITQHDSMYKIYRPAIFQNTNESYPVDKNIPIMAAWMTVSTITGLLKICSPSLYSRNCEIEYRSLDISLVDVYGLSTREPMILMSYITSGHNIKEDGLISVRWHSQRILYDRSDMRSLLKGKAVGNFKVGDLKKKKGTDQYNIAELEIPR